MTQAILKPLTFDEFIDWYPENSENRYDSMNLLTGILKILKTVTNCTRELLLRCLKQPENIQK
jgi:Uma2 family endonuclease